MHGLGNDYIIIDFPPNIDHSNFARHFTRRRWGIGADGLLVVEPALKEADFRMRMFNADGSEAEMCGNGLRCFARFVYEKKGLAQAGQKVFKVETLAGVLKVEILGEGNAVEGVRVEMGRPRLEREQIPMVGPPGKVLGEKFQVKDRTFWLSAVSMGNPHAILEVEALEKFPVSEWGPLIEKDKRFPRGINVEFIEILGRKRIRQRTWERGCGETDACGTGASAVCVVSHLLGKTDREVTVELNGGPLHLFWKPEGTLIATGPAETVFEGEVFWEKAENF